MQIFGFYLIQFVIILAMSKNLQKIKKKNNIYEEKWHFCIEQYIENIEQKTLN